MSSRKVTVAMLGDPDTAFTIEAIDWHRQFGEDADDPPVFDDLPQVEFDVSEDETLGSVLARAADRFKLTAQPDVGMEMSIGFFAFDEPGSQITLHHDLTLVDDEGHAVWGVWEWRETPFGAVVRAAEAGAIEGLPTRLFLVLLPPMGGGTLLLWSQVLTAWEIADQVLFEISWGSDAFGALVIHEVRKRLRRGRPVVSQHYIEWDQRGGIPQLVGGFLTSREWDPAVLAALLGCSREEAGDILGIYGFEEGEDGRWRAGESDAARILQEVQTQTAVHTETASFEAILKRTLRDFVITGSVPEPTAGEDAS